ncbi:MAG: FtsX-like permease family protein [Zoogloeaceae bacterium]|nr:FtsX-like permease family protein [Zoogloeaceae bacterium]
MSAVLRRVFVASLLRQRLAAALSLLAVTLGVALALAVQVIHDAAVAELGRSVRTLAGEADLQVVGGKEGFTEEVLDRVLALSGVEEASPVVELEPVLGPGGDDRRRLRILGLDLFRALRLQPGLRPMAPEGAGRLATLAQDGLFPTPAAMTDLGLSVGGSLALGAAGVPPSVWRVAGQSGVDGAALGGDWPPLAVADIGAVQWRFGWLGRLSRIDIRLRPGVTESQIRASLEGLLPAGVELQRPVLGESQAAALSRAYRVNLTLLAVMALLTGGFLVFSTQALSVVRRRSELAFLRAIGLDRRVLAQGLLLEGAVIGLIGGILGVGMGYALAAGVLAVLGGDLGAGYFQGVAPALGFSWRPAVGYAVLGMVAALAGAWAPAREALAAVPAQALKAGDEIRVFVFRPRFGVAVASLCGGWVLCWLPPIWGISLGGYGAVLAALVGGLALLPAFTSAVVGWLPRPGAVSRLAACRLTAAPGQAVIAAAGVLTSVALAAAMAIMVASFRQSVVDWLDQVLPADLYLRSVGGGALDEGRQDWVAAVPGIARVLWTRQDSVRVIPQEAPMALLVRPVTAGVALPLVNEGRPPRGAAPVWLSESARDRLGLAPGDRLPLPVGGEMREFGVAGVWRDYVRQQGAMVIEQDDWRRFGGDPRVHDAAIFLTEGTSPGAVARALNEVLGSGVEISEPGLLRKASLALFDRTFAVTYLLEGVAVAIGLFGIATSFAAMATARRREFGMLRHLGLSRRQVGRMLALEGMWTATAGVAVGLGAGGAIALILVRVVNPQSFHWSMDLHVPWTSLAAFAILLVGLAALAARLAGRHAMEQGAVLAVREDW